MINHLKYDSRFVGFVEDNVFPEEFYDALFKYDVKLFPSSITNIKIDCNCSKRKIICKHVVALLCDFTFVLEHNPYLLFEMKGSDIRSLPYHFDVPGVEDDEDTGICSVSDLFDESSLAVLDGVEDACLDRIPFLGNNVLLLEDNPSFYSEGNFRSVLDDLFSSMKSFLDDEVLSYIEDNDEDDFVEFYRLPLGFKHGSDAVSTLYSKWGSVSYWNKLQININSNYSITKVDIDCKENFGKFKSEEVIFAFLTELSSCSFNISQREVNFLLSVYRFCLELIRRSAIVPEFFTCNDKYLIRWIPAYSNKVISGLIKQLVDSCPDMLITFNRKKISGKSQVFACVSLIIKGFIDTFLGNDERFINRYGEDPFLNLFLGRSERFNDKSVVDSVNDWVLPLNNRSADYKISLIVDEEDEMFNVSVNVDLDDGKSGSLSDVISSTEDGVLKENLIRDLGIIGNVFPGMGETGEKVTLDVSEFEDFFNTVVPTLESVGVNVVVPDAFSTISHPRLFLDISNFNPDKSYLSLENLLKFDWRVAIGDYNVSVDEFRKLTKSNKSFITVGGRLVVVDLNEVNHLLDGLDNLPDHLGSNELIRCIVSEEFDDLRVEVSERIRNLILNHEGNDIPLPDGLCANLRDYQRLGYNWLAQNVHVGFGSILADDMGLGKTLQTLTLILKLKEDGLLNGEKVLIVAPTSILFNWEHEISKFTPDLSCLIYHGTSRTLKYKRFDVLITSYAIVRQDRELLESRKWFLVVVDEAQNIKNPSSQQTVAIKSINARHHIALTGTPIENRLSEYWSIFDFVNHDYLGSLYNFRKKYINPIENDHDMDVLEELKQITQPFVLRRLKTDDDIVDELPKKVTNDIYCNLTPDQASIYQQLLDGHMKKIENLEGISRRGRVLELINSLKQVCNHPSQLMDEDDACVDDSGKMQVLMSTLETILDNDEKVLIFTQYVKTGNIMKKLIEEEFDETVMFLHGSLSKKERERQVMSFQEDDDVKIFILSLRAGGTGLNLTAASNVIHYDLWWNPAVESQATDRAYRIGQSSNVMVYRLITSGTFEERINDMINDKRELAEITIGNGGKFITEMDDDKLLEILKLRMN